MFFEKHPIFKNPVIFQQHTRIPIGIQPVKSRIFDGFVKRHRSIAEHRAGIKKRSDKGIFANPPLLN
jgi:hypothetical protein